MKLSFGQKDRNEPSDAEIERDVAELRRLLEGVKEPNEPHPAYYQNFLVRVHDRIDEDRFRRKRWSPSVAWASMTAAALVVVLAVSGLLPTVDDSVGGRKIVQEQPAPRTGSVRQQIPSGAGSERDPLLYDQSARSLVLSSDDMKMLNAIMSNDDDAVFRAMMESESL